MDLGVACLHLHGLKPESIHGRYDLSNLVRVRLYSVTFVNAIDDLRQK